MILLPRLITLLITVRDPPFIILLIKIMAASIFKEEFHIFMQTALADCFGRLLWLPLSENK
jgi:hypothetical protein